jgi:hypothetical protein
MRRHMSVICANAETHTCAQTGVTHDPTSLDPALMAAIAGEGYAGIARCDRGAGRATGCDIMISMCPMRAGSRDSKGRR